MNASQIVITRMHDSFSQAEYAGSLQDCLEELAQKAGEVLDAACAIVMLSESQVEEIGLLPGTGFGDVLEGHPCVSAHKDAQAADTLAGMRMFSAIVMQGKVVGVIRAHPRQPTRCFDTDDLQLFGLVAVVITKSIQVIQLQNILNSRFAQLALTRATDKTIGEIVAETAQSPNQMARILAKSFYREMIGAGFNFNQILFAATEVISELTDNMRKHRDAYRRRVVKAKAHELEGIAASAGQADAI